MEQRELGEAGPHFAALCLNSWRGAREGEYGLLAVTDTVSVLFQLRSGSMGEGPTGLSTSFTGFQAAFLAWPAELSALGREGMAEQAQGWGVP